MNVAGIDYSTRAVDIVLLPEFGTRVGALGRPLWARFELTGNDAFDRTRSVADVVPGRGSVFWDDILAVGIEHPGGKYGTGDMLRIQGAILSCIPARMLVEPWPPAKWRTANGLKGNADKCSVYVHSCLKTAIAGAVTTDWPQDAHDAHLIALATRQAITTTQTA